MCIHYMHHIDCYLIFFCALTLSNAVCPWFLFVFVFLSFKLLALWLGRLELRKRTPYLLLCFKVIGLDP